MFLIVGIILASDKTSFQLMKVVNNNDQEFITLTNEKQIMQSFVINEDSRLTGIGLNHSSSQKIVGSLNLAIYETASPSSSKLRPRDKLVNVEKELEYFSVDDQLIFSFPSIIFKKGTYLMILDSKLEEGSVFHIIKSKNEIYESGKLYITNPSSLINTTPVSGDLAFTIYEKKGFFSILERFEKKSILAPIVVLIFLIITIIMAALIISEFPVKKSQTTDVDL